VAACDLSAAEGRGKEDDQSQLAGVYGNVGDVAGLVRIWRSPEEVPRCCCSHARLVVVITSESQLQLRI